jgi:hypothetical protein
MVLSIENPKICRDAKVSQMPMEARTLAKVTPNDGGEWQCD